MLALDYRAHASNGEGERCVLDFVGEAPSVKFSVLSAERRIRCLTVTTSNLGEIFARSDPSEQRVDDLSRLLSRAVRRRDAVTAEGNVNRPDPHR